FVRRRGRVDDEFGDRGGRVDVAGGVGGGDGEGVRALAERRVALRARAGNRGGAVERAAERARLAGGEGKRRRAVFGVPGRAAVDRRLRRGRVDGPGAGRRQAQVAGRVARLDREGVVSLGQPSVGDRAGAGGEGGTVERAEEGRARLGRAEGEERARAPGRPGRAAQED